MVFYAFRQPIHSMDFILFWLNADSKFCNVKYVHQQYHFSDKISQCIRTTKLFSSNLNRVFVALQLQYLKLY